MKIDKNLIMVWTMLVGTATAIVWMFTQFASAERVDALELTHNTFVTSSEFQEYVLSDMYDSYYQFLDRLYKFEELGNMEMVLQIERQLSRLRAKICASDPEWEECDGSIRY